MISEDSIAAGTGSVVSCADSDVSGEGLLSKRSSCPCVAAWNLDGVPYRIELCDII